MTDLPIAQSVLDHTHRETATCALTYEGRFFRRKKLTTTDGWSFVADFEQTVSLNHGDILALNNGRHVRIVAAPENLLAVTGDALPRLAWHIGNRHTPCQIESGRVLILNDPVIAHMLDHLGAKVHAVTEPFTPEGGAYGHGRTHSHDHGNSTHDHDHTHAH